MNRPAILAIAGGAIAIVAALLWFFVLDEQGADEARRPAQQAATPSTAPAPAPVPALKPPQPNLPLAAPSFDVVRVNPDGRAVIAGRAAPGARVTVLDGGKEIGSVDADARGEWVLLPDQPLAPGTRELSLRAQVGQEAPRGSEKSVVLMVPEGQGGALAVAVPRDPKAGGSTVLQTPAESEGLARSGDLVLGTVDYDAQGNFQINGKAPPGTVVQAYVGNKLVGRGQADPQGLWRITPTEKIAEGTHQLRIDQVQPDGKVIARLEVPFGKTTTGEVVTPQAITIVPGNNLWRIAQRIYGEGLRYTVIYQANRGVIKDPDLIYPGQVFVLPKIN
jgi:nucleoid-associated protein YgaU